jgi:hypothetical protein
LIECALSSRYKGSCGTNLIAKRFGDRYGHVAIRVSTLRASGNRTNVPLSGTADALTKERRQEGVSPCHSFGPCCRRVLSQS